MEQMRHTPPTASTPEATESTQSPVEQAHAALAAIAGYKTAAMEDKIETVQSIMEHFAVQGDAAVAAALQKELNALRLKEGLARGRAHLKELSEAEDKAA